tara:strand:+ start:470 stop:667 length:198 start_codon:yes stop_codon:yes gene_type:complete
LQKINQNHKACRFDFSAHRKSIPRRNRVYFLSNSYNWLKNAHFIAGNKKILRFVAFQNLTIRTGF